MKTKCWPPCKTCCQPLPYLLRTLWCLHVEIPPILEPSGLFRSDGKKMDVAVVPWKSGRALAWDVTCSDILAPPNFPTAASGVDMVAS